MTFLKITNIIPTGGNKMFDYKGLNIDLFSTPEYPLDNSFCYVSTIEGEIPVHPDITILTEKEYYQLIKEIKKTPMHDPITELRQENSELKKAIADLTMTLASVMMD